MLLMVSLMGAEFGSSPMQPAMAESLQQDKDSMQEAPLTVQEATEVTELEDLPSEEQEVIAKAVSEAEASGEAAGEALNELEGGEAVAVGVKEVLDTYYGAETVDEEAVADFSEALEEDITEDVADYTEAREERDNEESLDYVAGEELVIFDKDTSKEDIDTVVSNLSESYDIILDNDFEMDTSLSERKQQRLKALESYRGDIVVRVKLNLDQTVAGAEEEFEAYDCVVEAEPNGKCEVSGMASKLNDEYVNSQWYLDRCNFKEAWDSVSTAGCDDIWIAVVDTGCRVKHKDLADGIVNRYAVDVTQKDAGGKYVKLEDMREPYDSEHGTWCTGIIAARANNSIGIAGAARGWENTSCKAIPIKVSFGEKNGKEQFKESDIYLGIKKAVDSGAEVVNVSLGGYQAHKAYEMAVDYAKTAGVIVVAAAGNNGKNIGKYPAVLDYVIAVGGTDQSSSNKKYRDSNFGSWVDIVAPATNFKSTSSWSNTAYDGFLEGTSLAAPLVSSAIGLMLSVNPDLTPAQIKNILYSAATDINSSYFNCGLLNAGLAVQKAKYQEFKNSTVTLNGATALANSRVKLKWNTLRVYGPEKVIVYRADSKSGKYLRIKAISGDAVLSGTYTDSGLRAGKVYYYKVRAAMRYGSGYKYTPYSEIKSVKAIE